MNLVRCAKCNEFVLAERFCGRCGGQLVPLSISRSSGGAESSSTLLLGKAAPLLPASETLTSDSPLGKDLDRIEHLAVLVAGIAERIVQSLTDDQSDSRCDSNGNKKSKNGKQDKKGKSETAVKMFTIGAISVILISAIVTTGLCGLSANTAIPLAASIIIFAFASWLVLCSHR